MTSNLIKNFCIIAHIDHGKSTLSDRLIEMASIVNLRNFKPQLLDSMDLERERGITIKLNSVRLSYKGIQLNLIDTPGHMDFNYEVSRSLSACEGAILVIDSTKGIQAQTIFNFFLALEANLEIVVAINKVDLPSSLVDLTKQQIKNNLGLDPSEAICISAKSGLGVDTLLEKCIEKFPSAATNSELPLKAIIFDSYYDSFKGVVIFIRIFDGILRKGDFVLCWQTNKKACVIDLGIKTPYMQSTDCISAGEVGWVNLNVRNISEVKVGDTLTIFDNPCSQPLPGYKETLPMVYVSFFPIVSENQNVFKSAIEKLSLSDGSFVYQYESSPSLGFGARCGFLGLLHLEIIKERLFREFGIEIIVSKPSVKYKVILKNSESFYLKTPSELPDLTKVSSLQEPFILLSINVPKQYIGKMMELLEQYEGKYLDLVYLSLEQALLKYELPFRQIIQDFYDAVKTLSNGYASVDYEILDYRESKLVKVDILLNGVIAPLFSFITSSSQAYREAKKLVVSLKENISQHLFEIVIQAAINSKVIVRESISAFRKNVTAKCYGGDITRKKKLLEKQKEGKKKMKQIGKVSIPPDIFEKIFTN